MHVHILNATKIWDSFINMIFEFKLYKVQSSEIENSPGTRIILDIFNQFRNFTIKYVDNLREQIKGHPYSELKELDIIDMVITMLLLLILPYAYLYL